MQSCGPFVFAEGINGIYCPLGKTKAFCQHDLKGKGHLFQTDEDFCAGGAPSQKHPFCRL